MQDQTLQYYWTESTPDLPHIKVVHSKDYHSMFNILTGELHRWGHTPQDPPGRSPAPGYFFPPCLLH